MVTSGLLIGGWFISPIVGQVIEKLRSYIGDNQDLDNAVEEMLEELESALPRIQGIINAAEGRPIRQPSLADWLRRLKDAVYEADDVLDYFEARHRLNEMESDDEMEPDAPPSDLTSEIPFSAGSPSQMPPSQADVVAMGAMDKLFEVTSKGMDNLRQQVRQFKAPHLKKFKNLPKKLKAIMLPDYALTRLRQIVVKLNKICAEAANRLVELDVYKSMNRDKTSETTSLLRDKVFGREKERLTVLEKMLSPIEKPESSEMGDASDRGGPSSSRSSSLRVLPIVGPGGVGKTTLAQLIYNDELVAEHFNLRRWVYVSDVFDVKRISLELLEWDAHTSGSLQYILHRVKAFFEKERFLIVLDDVWDEKGEKWEDLCAFLDCGVEGSMVLVTTQSGKVAKVMGTMDPIVLDVLPEDDFWDFFKHCAFRDTSLEGQRMRALEQIGRQIVTKLPGLPLSAKALGSLLRPDLSVDFWNEILRSEWWELDPVLNDILPSLGLSYQHLQTNLKQCFAYCSIFPKGYIFEKDKLVQMWIAQGFIQPNPRGGMRIEDVGGRWFDELTNRSFFQVAWDGRYVMHDLMHELAVSVSLDECFVVNRHDELEKIPSTVRHLTVVNRHDELEKIPSTVRHLTVRSDTEAVIKGVHRYGNLRTLLYFGYYTSSDWGVVLEGMLKHLKRLRVLNLSHSIMTEYMLPGAVGGLSHLRYLDLSHTDVTRLPESFCRLCHLQVLNLQGCDRVELPAAMNKMISIRHLYADGETISGIAGIGKLTNLQELSDFRVKRNAGHSISELKDLKELHGQLRLVNIESIESKEEATEAQLMDKKLLNRLELLCEDAHQAFTQEVLEGLQPHPNLNELEIKGYGGSQPPSWMVDNKLLTNLQSLSLTECSWMQRLPTLGELPFLKVLHLDGLDLTEFGRQVYGSTSRVFPSLDELAFSNMRSWQKWEEAPRPLPCLRKLRLECGSLRNLPLYSLGSSVEELSISCPALDSELPRYLRKLRIERCRSLGILPRYLRTLTSLSMLELGSYENEISLCLPNMSKLQRLTLLRCPKLRLEPSHEEQGLRSLTHIVMDDVLLLNDECVQLGSLPSLRSLQFRFCQRLRYFSEKSEVWLRQLTSLKELEFCTCDSLENLPANLASFTSIKRLNLVACEKILSLPEMGLPISLKELHISSCPSLGEGCQKEPQGPEWPKIAYIPYIRIDHETVQMLSEGKSSI